MGIPYVGWLVEGVGSRNATRTWHPSGVRVVLRTESGGVASLNPRLMSGSPPGWLIQLTTPSLPLHFALGPNGHDFFIFDQARNDTTPSASTICE